MSLWLATHLTDLLEKLNLVDDDDDETYELPLRDYFVIQYTDMLLLGHEGYWEIACDYLSGCGTQGVGRIREVLRRVSLNLGPKEISLQATDESQDAVMDGSGDVEPVKQDSEAMDSLARVTALLRVASDHGLEDERREICRVSTKTGELENTVGTDSMALHFQLAALQLLKLRRYGPAFAYCVHSMDARLSAVIGEAVLDVYCTEGKSSECGFRFWELTTI